MKTGLENFLSTKHQKYRGQKLGIVCNQASINNKLVHAGDLLLDKKLKLDISCFIGPQHGIRGEKQDNMIESPDFIDPRTKLTVYSLYGDSREPTGAMLQKIDTFVIDLQDVGTRIYTFMYTMANCMRAAEAHGKKVVILDRPNPIGAHVVEGNLLENDFTSFVGQFPMCTRHGMTMGELALMFNEAFQIGCDLDVIRVTGWDRKTHFDSWKRDWVYPSPNLPNYESTLTFPGTVHFEGTNISEGRGTTKPFEQIGAPFIDPDALATTMNKKKLPGVWFRPIFFQPTYQKWKDSVCGGVHIHITNKNQFRPFRAGIELLHAMVLQAPGKFEWKQPPYEYEHDRMPIDLIAGTAQLRELIDRGQGLTQFYERAESDAREFAKIRRKFLIY